MKINNAAGDTALLMIRMSLFIFIDQFFHLQFYHRRFLIKKFFITDATHSNKYVIFGLSMKMHA